MGIEGGSNNREVQSQEIQQANSEQNELNQADHKRSGEELEANSTIDNEGERKQIEGREETTDSKDGNVSRLEDAETIEDERQGSGIENVEGSYFVQDNLDDLGTIEDDTESFDDPNSHVVVGVDRSEGAGHWFNAYYDGFQVYTIEGQTGEIHGWPPDYGDVVHWDVSV